MKLYRLIVLILSLGAVACTKTIDESAADEFIRFYGDARVDAAYDLKTDGSGGYLITGTATVLRRSQVADNLTTIKSSDPQLMVLRTNEYGKQIWMTTAGTGFSDEGNASVLMSDGSIVSTGSQQDTTASGSYVKDVLVAKMDLNGNLIWTKNFGGVSNQYGTDLVETRDGNILIAGVTDNYRAGGETGNPQGVPDVLVMKVSASGDSLWSRAIGWNGRDQAVRIIQDPSSGYLILGQTERSVGDQDQTNILLVRINETGDVIAPNTLGTANDDYATDLEVLDNGYVISGYTFTEDAVNGMMVMVSTDIYATPVFYKNDYSVSGTDTYITGVATRSDNGFLATGYHGASGNEKIFIHYLDESGQEQLPPTSYGGTGMQFGWDIIADEHNYVVVAGANRSGNNSMITLMKIRSDLSQ